MAWARSTSFLSLAISISRRIVGASWRETRKRWVEVEAMLYTRFAYARSAPAGPASDKRRGGSANMLGCSLAQLRSHQLRLQCPGEEGNAANEDGWNARDAEMAGLGLSFDHLRRTLIAFESGAHLRAGETGLFGNIGQNRGIADVSTLGEVAAEKGFDHLVLLVLPPGEPDEAMRVEG